MFIYCNTINKDYYQVLKIQMDDYVYLKPIRFLYKKPASIGF